MCCTWLHSTWFLDCKTLIPVLTLPHDDHLRILSEQIYIVLSTAAAAV